MPGAEPAVLAAGAWLAASLGLLTLLRAASGASASARRASALRAARWLSMVPLIAAPVVASAGLRGARSAGGWLPYLVGTPTGHVVLVALIPLGAMLSIAGWRACRLAARAVSHAVSARMPRRLVALTAVEGALAFVLVLVTVLVAVAPREATEEPVWPLSVRLAPWIAWNSPDMRMKVALGAAIAALGILASVASGLLARWRPLFIAAALILLISGAVKALSPLTVDAYPTTYLRPSVPYTAESIARGAALFAAHCAACHGARGRGDGPAAASLIQIPADLTAPHTGDHTAGDLFWWLTNGLGLAMPAFGDRLSVRDRWDLINFVRALSAGEQARDLTATLRRDGLRVAAPDFAISTGAPRRLKDHRGEPVLLVLFSPSSLPRLDQLARAHGGLVSAGARLLAVPMNGARDALSRPPQASWPFAVAGDDARAIAETYTIFATDPGAGRHGARPATHAEFLIDRSGYLRARWMSGGPDAGWGDVQVLLAQVRTASREALAEPPEDAVR